jgi:septal ring factor EnvC (AmiA/AmiB activator)
MAATTASGVKNHDPGNVGGAFAALRGQLRLPVKGTIAGRFGSPRAEGGASWKGIFIRAAEGAEVKAVAGGAVVFSDWLRGFGNLLIIDHGDDFLSVYGNNESLLATVGASVKGGESVATVGNSGGNPDSGLYFELRHRGQPFDPLKWASNR